MCIYIYIQLIIFIYWSSSKEFIVWVYLNIGYPRIDGFTYINVYIYIYDIMFPVKTATTLGMR